MEDKDCYLFIDLDVPEEHRCMSIMCVKCHDEKMPDCGSFHEGSKLGYSNYDWICDLCGEIIHKAEQEIDE